MDRIMLALMESAKRAPRLGRALAVVLLAAATVAGTVSSASAEERWRRHEDRHEEWGPGPGHHGPDRFVPPPRHMPAPEWRGDIHRFHEHDIVVWRGGNWWRGAHDGRNGWWWIVGGVWYWYPKPIYPFPDPYRPPQVSAPSGEAWFYCRNPEGYYPYVNRCRVPWEVMTSQAAPPPPVAVAPPPPPPATRGGNEIGGTVLGAIGGGLLGAQVGHGTGQIAAAAAGTLLGAFIGNEIGQSLDRADAMAAADASRSAYGAPMGQTITWNNPSNGHNGTITPVREGQDSGGNYCREFQQNVQVGGRTQQAYGKACRKPDGAWEVVND